MNLATPTTNRERLLADTIDAAVELIRLGQRSIRCVVCGFDSDDPYAFASHANWHNSIPSLRDENAS